MVRGEHHSAIEQSSQGRQARPEVKECTTFSISIETESRCTVAAHLERSAATELARSEADRRRTGRMFLAGSERPCRGNIVVIVDDKDTTLQLH